MTDIDEFEDEEIDRAFTYVLTEIVKIQQRLKKLEEKVNGNTN